MYFTKIEVEREFLSGYLHAKNKEPNITYKDYVTKKMFEQSEFSRSFVNSFNNDIEKWINSYYADINFKVFLKNNLTVETRSDKSIQDAIKEVKKDKDNILRKIWDIQADIHQYITNELYKIIIDEENATSKKEKKPTSSTSNKIQVKGSLQSIGYLFSELIKKGYIEVPKRNGNPNTSEISRMILEHFEFINREFEQKKPPTAESIRQTLFSKNSLSADKQKLFKIPESNIINTD